MGRLPDFIVIGATKCGTTTLHAVLDAHPGVFMARKELRFFSTQHNWRRGLDWYREQFGEAAPEQLVGEGSNSYTRHPLYDGVPGRIARLLPEVRLVYIVRHPLERIASHYRHRQVIGKEWRPASQALREEPSYLAVSRYGQQLAEFRRFFAPERILVLRLERLHADPTRELGRLFDFLGLDTPPGVELPARNVTAERPLAPLWLRRASRFGPLRRLIRPTRRGLRRLGLSERLAPAEASPFEPDSAALLALEHELSLDRALLEELSGESFADWTPAALSGSGRPSC